MRRPGRDVPAFLILILSSVGPRPPPNEVLEEERLYIYVSKNRKERGRQTRLRIEEIDTHITRLKESPPFDLTAREGERARSRKRRAEDKPGKRKK